MGKKVLHIVLLCMVYLSSTGMILQQHYCSDELVNAAWMGTPESCHAQAACTEHNVPVQDDCCSNDVVLMKTELNHDLYQPSLKSFSQDLFTAAFFFLIPIVEPVEADESLLRAVTWRPPSSQSVYLPVVQRFNC